MLLQFPKKPKMIKPANFTHENDRLKSLESYSIIDSISENDYDNLTAIASEICNTPISLVTLLDENRQWFKSHHGLTVSETSRDISFCGHAINQDEDIFIVQDARSDIRFHDNPLVTGNPNIIFYAGVVLKTADNFPLGTLCVIDSKPNLLNASQIKSLKALSNQVMNLLELRKNKIQLEKVNKELEENNRELEKFASVAAHDLKSPLNNIYSLANLLSDEYGSKIDAEGQQLLDYIILSSENLKNLIGGLLDYSKTAKLIKVDKTQINLEKIIQGIKSYYSFENKCLINLNTSLTNIYSNKTAVEQILINLITNSHKYSDKSITEIEIEITENVSEYLIAVKDNGPGIKKEYHGKIFDMFETYNLDKNGNSGNGIGLATVKKLVEALGGQISVASDFGHGTIFTFTISKD